MVKDYLIICVFGGLKQNPYRSEYKTAFFPLEIGPKKSGRLIFGV